MPASSSRCAKRLAARAPVEHRSHSYLACLAAPKSEPWTEAFGASAYGALLGLQWLVNMPRGCKALDTGSEVRDLRLLDPRDAGLEAFSAQK